MKTTEHKKKKKKLLKRTKTHTHPTTKKILMLSGITILLLIIALVSVIALSVWPTYKLFQSLKQIANNDSLCQCEGVDCDLYVPQALPLPKMPTDPTVYDAPTGLFAIDMVARVLQASKGTTLELPHGFKLVKTFTRTSKNDSVLFGVLAKHENLTVLAFKGTTSLEEWKIDFNVKQQSTILTQTPLQQRLPFRTAHITVTEKDPGCGRVLDPMAHAGFLSVYMQFRDELLQALASDPPGKRLLVAGHSLGAGVGTIAALDICSNLSLPYVQLYTSGCPRIGNEAFVHALKACIVDRHVLRNEADIIPTMPLAVSPNPDNNDVPLMFAHYGPTVTFTQNWGSLVQNHLLQNYGTFLESL